MVLPLTIREVMFQSLEKCKLISNNPYFIEMSDSGSPRSQGSNEAQEEPQVIQMSQAEINRSVKGLMTNHNLDKDDATELFKINAKKKAMRVDDPKGYRKNPEYQELLQRGRELQNKNKDGKPSASKKRDVDKTPDELASLHKLSDEEANELYEIIQEEASLKERLSDFQNRKRELKNKNRETTTVSIEL